MTKSLDLWSYKQGLEKAKDFVIDEIKYIEANESPKDALMSLLESIEKELGQEVIG